MIGGASKTLLISTLNRIIHKPEDLLRNITFLSSGLANLAPYEKKWETCLTSYLGGKGHIAHEDLLQMVSNDEITLVQESHTFRAKCLARYLTGVSLVPDTPITVCYEYSSLDLLIINSHLQIRFEDRTRLIGDDAIKFNDSKGVSTNLNFWS